MIKLTICLMLAAVSCDTVNKKLGIPNDDPIEQEVIEVVEDIAEVAIERETGIKIDFTPTPAAPKQAELILPKAPSDAPKT